jgi:hypothetical protein
MRQLRVGEEHTIPAICRFMLRGILLTPIRKAILLLLFLVVQVEPKLLQ